MNGKQNQVDTLPRNRSMKGKCITMKNPIFVADINQSRVLILNINTRRIRFQRDMRYRVRNRNTKFTNKRDIPTSWSRILSGYEIASSPRFKDSGFIESV